MQQTIERTQELAEQEPVVEPKKPRWFVMRLNGLWKMVLYRKILTPLIFISLQQSEILSAIT